jgi:hypothetical protein
MASIEYVVRATDAASTVFAKIAASADGLDSQLEDLSKRVATPEVDLKDAKFTAGIIRAAERLDKLSAKVAEPGADLSDTKFQAEILKINAQLDRLDARHVTADVKVKVDQSALSKLRGLLGAAGKGAGGLGAAGGLFAAGSAGIGLAGPIGAAGVAMAAFGAVAIPTIMKVEGAQQQLTAATLAYQKATTAAGRQSALAAQAQATSDLSRSEKALMGPLADLAKLWANLEAALAPVTLYVVKFADVILREAMPAIRTLAHAGGAMVTAFLAPLDQLIASGTFRQFIASLVKFGDAASAIMGPAVESLLKAFMQLFIQTMPSGLKILRALLPAIVQMVVDLTPAIVAVTNMTAAVITWLSKSRLLVPALFAITGALIAMKLALLSNPFVLIAAAVAALAFVIIKYHKQIWSFLTGIWGDIFGFLKRTWGDIAQWSARTWDDIYSHTAGVVIRLGHNVETQFNSIRHAIADAFDAVRHVFAGFGHSIADTFDRVRRFQGQFDAFGKDIGLVRHWI